MRLTPATLLKAYAIGIFPMAESRTSPVVHWMDPPMRGILPLDAFHVPRRLRRTVRKKPFSVRSDTAFEAVVRTCAAPRIGQPESWINDEIRALFLALHRTGSAHSVECWQGDRLVGGLYGLAMGGAFFGESMFSIAPDASKVALVHLVARLLRGGFTLLDTQFVTEHLSQFGACEIPRASYRVKLADAIARDADFHCFGDDPDPDTVLQSITHTS